MNNASILDISNRKPEKEKRFFFCNTHLLKKKNLLVSIDWPLVHNHNKRLNHFLKTMAHWLLSDRSVPTWAVFPIITMFPCQLIFLLSQTLEEPHRIERKSCCNFRRWRKMHFLDYLIIYLLPILVTLQVCTNTSLMLQTYNIHFTYSYGKQYCLYFFARSKRNCF